MPRGRPRTDKGKVVELVPRKEQEVIKPTITVEGQPLVERSKFRPLTPEERAAKQEEFMEIYQRAGNIKLACQAIGIHFTTLHDWLNKDEEFATRFTSEGRAALVYNAESDLHSIAFGDVTAPSSRVTAIMAILNANDREKYQPRSTVDMNVRVMADYKGFANREG
jgi:transposase-like protein